MDGQAMSDEDDPDTGRALVSRRPTKTSAENASQSNKTDLLGSETARESAFSHSEQDYEDYMSRIKERLNNSQEAKQDIGNLLWPQ
jgi:uncharacterized protein YeaO (DUF488 family)